MGKSVHFVFSDMFLWRDSGNQVLYERFCHLKYIFLFDETHLTVDLVELT